LYKVLSIADLVDTAQGYGNEGEVGIALHESGLSRGDVFITTKYSGYDGLDIPTAIRNSVNNVSDSLQRSTWMLMKPDWHALRRPIPDS
jgi:diketogulonate reductase-like aldo/keto reductase